MQNMLAINLISANPTIRGGRPCVDGTSLRVTDIAIAHLFHDRTVDQIATDYELSLAQVYAALSYYYQDKADLDADIRDQLMAARRLKEQSNGDDHSLLS